MIRIDLNHLTERHLAEAKPNVGKCSYAAPCIIGTLMPAEERLNPRWAYRNVGSLAGRGEVALPGHQRLDAERMQFHFDEGNWDAVERIARKYIYRREAEELRKLRGRLSAYQVQNPAWPNIKLRARIAELSAMIETAHCGHCGTPVTPWAEKCYSCLGELSA